MRVLIIGNLAGQLSAATKIAFDKGAKVLHAHDAVTAMELLRTGRGADIVMIDVHEDIRSLVNAMKQERIVAPVVACGIGASPDTAANAIRAGAREFIPLPPDPELIAAVLAAVADDDRPLIAQDSAMIEIKQLADGLLDRPALIEVARRNSTVEVIDQKIHPVDRKRKAELLLHLIRERSWTQVLVFTRTKHGANRLAEYLDKAGISSMAIHGNKSQGARTRALSEFKAAKLRVLVATDIAARGIDIEELPQVVNYELPNVPEDYIHRIGRTGRAGASGAAVSLVCIDELDFLRDIERLIKRTIPREFIAGFDLDPNAIPEPIVQGGRGSRGGGGGGARHSQGGNSGRHASPGQGSSQRSASAPRPQGRPAERSSDGRRR